MDEQYWLESGDYYDYLILRLLFGYEAAVDVALGRPMDWRTINNLQPHPFPIWK